MGFLSAARAEEIATALESSTFECHETLRRRRRDRSHCAGVLIVMAREQRFGDLQQIAMRLGLFDPSKLDMNAPTFNTLEEFVAANGGSEIRWRMERNGGMDPKTPAKRVAKPFRVR